MNKVNKEALFQEAALVLEEETPPQSPTHPAAAGKTPTTNDCQADLQLATTVEWGSGVICIDCMPSQRIQVIPPLLCSAP